MFINVLLIKKEYFTILELEAIKLICLVFVVVSFCCIYQLPINWKLNKIRSEKKRMTGYVFRRKGSSLFGNAR